MNKLRQVLVLVVVTFCILQCTSTLKNTFQNELDNYLLYSNSGEWDKLLDMTYPKVFELSSRDQMIESMKQMEASGLKINTKKAEVKSVSEPIVVDEVYYAHLEYEGEIEFILSEEMKAQSGIIFSQLKDSYNEGEVIFAEDKGAFHIEAIKSMFAISEDNKKTWTFFEYNKNQKEYLKELFPEDVLNKFMP